MFPKDIEIVECTKSEKIFYYALKNCLPDRVHVFYSLTWYWNSEGKRENSESDFLIFDPDFGYLTIEVKGGKKIEKTAEGWILENYDNSYRKLRRSPLAQAEESTYFFKRYFENQFHQSFQGVYGFACAFPNFNIIGDMGADIPKELIIDFSDLSDLGLKINNIFHYWASTRSSRPLIVDETKHKFLNMINKQITISTVKGITIEKLENKLNNLNKIQQNYIEFIENFNRALIVGGAGTGKTWIAMKKAIIDAIDGNDVLFVCYNSGLCSFIKELLSPYRSIKVVTFWQLIKELVSEAEFNTLKKDSELYGVYNYIANKEHLPKFNSIIVDEGQDFNNEWAKCIYLLLRDTKSTNLYIFMDEDQNIFHRNLKNDFNITHPPFTLRENLRNTSEIINWTKNSTNLGYYTRANTISGIEPKIISVNRKKDAKIKLEEILKKLILKESIAYNSITILSDRKIENSFLNGEYQLGMFHFSVVKNNSLNDSIIFRTVQSFKGLESDVIIYLKHGLENDKLDYVAYTRAKYLLYIIDFNE